MSYKTIQDLNLDLTNAVSSVNGLNEFYMIDESEVNTLRNIQYPVCISSIPNSSISDSNRAYEEYEMTLLILKKEKKTNRRSDSLKLYDECVDLFSSLTDHLMIQRGGVFIVEDDSIQIERVSRLGNDLATGIRVRFILLAPSSIAYPPSETELSIDSNLIGFFTTSMGRDVAVTASQVIWSKRQGTISNSLKNPILNQKPDFTNNVFLFKEPNNYPNAEALSVNGINLSSQNFTIIASIYAPDDTPFNDDRTIFAIDDDTHEGRMVALQIVSGGGDAGSVKVIHRLPNAQIQSSIFTLSDISPYGASGDFKSIALINNFTQNRIDVYIEMGNANVLGLVSLVNGAYSSQFPSNSFLRVGALMHAIQNNDRIFTKGFELPSIIGTSEAFI